ncbi:hypothetical protein HJC23_011497 [Cyclotella cryptica]|uniref:Uncharacterized protein n=1 Tax=Cyclotella cryptica TaxID=29204 RepID=A0ABD3PUM3_9STRA
MQVCCCFIVKMTMSVLLPVSPLTLFIHSAKMRIMACPMLAFHTHSILLYQIGPVLIKNDLEEAIDTVKKRLEFITGEMDKAQASITKKQEQSQQLAKKIQEMQGAMQKAAVEAAKAVAAGQS